LSQNKSHFIGVNGHFCNKDWKNGRARLLKQKQPKNITTVKKHFSGAARHY
jgi:hypothetical protein